jgi:hypothetical protein
VRCRTDACGGHRIVTAWRGHAPSMGARGCNGQATFLAACGCPVPNDPQGRPGAAVSTVLAASWRWVLLVSYDMPPAHTDSRLIKNPKPLMW